MRMVKYIFGRLHLIASYRDKAHFLWSLMSKRTSVRERQHEWVFTNIQRVSEEQGDTEFVSGFLTKVRPVNEAEVEDQGQLAHTEIENYVLGKAAFVLDMESGIIAFHPSQEISLKQFRRLFCRILTRAHEDVMIQAQIDIITEEHAILKALMEFDTITRLQVELQPANPSSRPIWQRIQGRLKRMRADSFREEFQSGEGLAITEEEDAYKELVMASDGFGKATLEGTMNGQVKTVSTEQIPVSGQAPAEEDGKAILAAIEHVFRDLWERMSQ